MSGNVFKPLNLSKLLDKKPIIVSSEKALKEVEPVNWSKDVLSGNKKILVDCKK